MNKYGNIYIEYYIVAFSFSDNNKYYTIWYTSDDDGFILREDKNCIKTFKELELLLEFAKENQYEIENTITEIICEESILLRSNEMDCDLLLTFWNMVSDVAKTVNISFEGDCRDDLIMSIYNKLFYGCNLAAIRKGGEYYSAIWSQKEKKALREVINDGVRVLKKSIDM